MAEALDPAGVELLHVTPAITLRVVTLTDIHSDPFDRLIIATALEHSAKLASMDGRFVHYPEIANQLI
jgi:PIN domain nuclease of toxin-antitoxin system